MEKVLVLLLLALAVAYAVPDPRGLIINLTLYGVYYKCPCERGLTCEVDRTIVGSITNTNFGVCLDASRSRK
ncbi:colipase isoform X2 [Neophocaena asiaeorientalis asiaeorientalis]|uniref:Colipase isoform X2 n=2 Tax=Phocoenidae TaxID=9740 RepID=A0A341D557_NEOAA|nr:colipase isoform X2 [Neophocaena asiaeorientalis asiaeorientalis]XP_032506040.1 colipase isoform X2 [Phocoena sinus]